MSLQIGKAIYHILRNDDNVTAKVNQKIFPLIANEGTTFPFIIYKRSGLEPATTKDRYVYKESVYVEVVIAAESYNESIDIADVVRSAFINKQGNISGIEVQGIELTTADEDYIEDTFTQTLTFKINTNGTSN